MKERKKEKKKKTARTYPIEKTKQKREMKKRVTRK